MNACFQTILWRYLYACTIFYTFQICHSIMCTNKWTSTTSSFPSAQHFNLHFSRPHCQYEFSCLHCKSSFSLYFDLFSIQCPVFQWSYYSLEVSHCKASCSPGFVTQSNFALLQYLLNTCIFSHHCTQQWKSPLVFSTGPLETSVSYVTTCSTHTLRQNSCLIVLFI